MSFRSTRHAWKAQGMADMSISPNDRTWNCSCYWREKQQNTGSRVCLNAIFGVTCTRCSHNPLPTLCVSDLVRAPSTCSFHLRKPLRTFCLADWSLHAMQISPLPEGFPAEVYGDRGTEVLCREISYRGGLFWRPCIGVLVRHLSRGLW